ncbi:hypothetical protein BD769DRAFT_1386133 [Suillus cothurnatus]|nr:hypothetical protein BD769DRAFT_1386133 [Suillus cothurnatus]
MNPTPRRQPPFITGGHFLAVMWVAIDEMKQCASRDSVEGKDVDLFISEMISHVCQSLKINHIPWSMNQVGGGGTPSSIIIHDVWLNLGATAIPRPPSSASFLTRQESLQIIALNSSTQIQLEDSQGDWSANDVHLNNFASVAHKVMTSSPQYIIDTYDYVQTTFISSVPIHQLALFVSMAFSSLLPNIYPPKIWGDVPKEAQELAFYIRNLEWVSRQKKGISELEPFITMMSTFIIALYELESPISVILHSQMPNIKELGLAKPCSTHALYSPKWGIDMKKLTSSEIAEKHAEVICLINTGGAQQIFWPKTFMSRLDLYPLLRSARDWDDDSRVTTASVIELLWLWWWWYKKGMQEFRVDGCTISETNPDEHEF